jgi:hypothetical protein
MRILLTILVLIIFLSTRAQSHLPINTLGFGYTQWQPFTPFTSLESGKQNRKWQLKPYASLSAGYIFLNGGISYLSAPVGLALVHPLNGNFSAFGAVSASPVIFSVNRLYTDPTIHSSYPGNSFSRPNLGLNGWIEGGLMYTNDAKTFSISGSVGVERDSYPVYLPNRANTKKP